MKLNMHMITILTAEDYCRLFSKSSTTIPFTYVVQMCASNGVDLDKKPYKKFVIMPLGDGRFLYAYCDTGAFRATGVTIKSCFYYTEDHGYVVTASFEDVLREVAAFNGQSLNPVLYPF